MDLSALHGQRLDLSLGGSSSSGGKEKSGKKQQQVKENNDRSNNSIIGTIPMQQQQFNQSSSGSASGTGGEGGGNSDGSIREEWVIRWEGDSHGDDSNKNTRQLQRCIRPVVALKGAHSNGSGDADSNKVVIGVPFEGQLCISRRSLYQNECNKGKTNYGNGKSTADKPAMTQSIPNLQPSYQYHIPQVHGLNVIYMPYGSTTQLSEVHKHQRSGSSLSYRKSIVSNSMKEGQEGVGTGEQAEYFSERKSRKPHKDRDAKKDKKRKHEKRDKDDITDSERPDGEVLPKKSKKHHKHKQNDEN